MWSLIASRVYRPGYRAPVRIRTLDHTRDPAACDAIIAGLPEWFGDEHGIRECAAAVRSRSGLVAVDDPDAVAGFLTWEPREANAAEITWMAVRADARRRGVGGLLVTGLVDLLREEGLDCLDVKTLSSRDPYPPYAETRAFYHANGFVEVEELDIWGPENPAVRLSRPI